MSGFPLNVRFKCVSSRFKSFNTKFWSQSELPLVLSCLRLQLLPIIRPGRPFCKISSNSPLFESGTFSWGASSPNLTLPPHLSSQRMDWMLKSEQCDVWGCFQVFDSGAFLQNPFHRITRFLNGLTYLLKGSTFLCREVFYLPELVLRAAFMQPK